MGTSRSERRITGTMVGMFFFAVVPAAGMAFMTFRIYPSGPWPFVIGFAVIWLAVGAFTLITEYREQPEVVRQQAVKEQLADLLAAGHKLAYKVETILDAKDRKALTNGFWRPMPLFIAFIVMLLVLAVYFDPYISLIALIPAAMLAYAWYIMYVTKKRNRKAILRGIITENIERRLSNADTTPHYYLTVGDVTFKVNPQIHEKYNTGDIIELHYAGPVRGGQVRRQWSHITQHRKLMPEEFDAWVKEFVGGGDSALSPNHPQ